ncbi:MAG: YggS family pyridoxal phosphate-dependent enzyme [Chitinophagaceae bacterium]|nr:YggS family pyridoxal phosphate-dependent enzyme [Chitinophagaceae bacterium]
MAVNKEAYESIKRELSENNIRLVAVSKTKPAEDIMTLYELGQRDFGENYVQELVDKYDTLPKDISWHFIGHLQSNKVKHIAPFVHLIHGIDSYKLLLEVNKQAQKNNRVIDVLLQIHIAEEETKFGLNEEELQELINKLAIEQMLHIKVRGLMGMASFTENKDQLRKEFQRLKSLFNKTSLSVSHASFNILSMGMSGDYHIAIECGSTMVRIGSLLFGERNYISSK